MCDTVLLLCVHCSIRDEYMMKIVKNYSPEMNETKRERKTSVDCLARVATVIITIIVWLHSYWQQIIMHLSRSNTGPTDLAT